MNRIIYEYTSDIEYDLDFLNTKNDSFEIVSKHINNKYIIEFKSKDLTYNELGAESKFVFYILELLLGFFPVDTIKAGNDENINIIKKWSRFNSNDLYKNNVCNFLGKINKKQFFTAYNNLKNNFGKINVVLGIYYDAKSNKSVLIDDILSKFLHALDGLSKECVKDCRFLSNSKTEKVKRIILNIDYTKELNITREENELINNHLISSLAHFGEKTFFTRISETMNAYRNSIFKQEFHDLKEEGVKILITELINKRDILAHAISKIQREVSGSTCKLYAEKFELMIRCMIMKYIGLEDCIDEMVLEGMIGKIEVENFIGVFNTNIYIDRITKEKAPLPNVTSNRCI